MKTKGDNHPFKIVPLYLENIFYKRVYVYCMYALIRKKILYIDFL